MELVEKLAALVPLPRVHLGRYSGCLAPHSHRRGAMIPTPRQQGVEDVATDTGSPRWSWARLLKRVFALEMGRCPCCQRGALRIIAAITHSEVMRKILQHLKLSAVPSHCPSPCPPGSLRLALCLTAPRASPTRLRPLPWGGTTPPPSPAPPDVSSHTARGLGGMAVLRPRLPSAPCWCPCAASLTVAASCTPARVCTRLSLVLAVPSCAPVSAAAPPQRLRRCKSFCISLFTLSSPL